MSQFINDHPWMFFWLVFVALITIDNIVANLANALRKNK